MKDMFILLEKPVDENIHKQNVSIIEKAINNKYNKTIVKCILQDLNNKNRNGRVYPKDRAVAMLNCEKIQEQLSYNGLKGEAGHPMTSYIEGDYIMGEVMASGPYGKYFEEDIVEGEFPAFSFRGIGNIEVVRGIPHAIIADPVTWDRVYYPSHRCAYMTGTINEMTTSINESAIPLNESSNELIMTESKSILIPENTFSFIKDESKKIKRISEALDVEAVKVINYSKTNNTVTVLSEDGSSFMCTLEHYVAKQIKSYV